MQQSRWVLEIVKARSSAQKVPGCAVSVGRERMNVEVQAEGRRGKNADGDGAAYGDLALVWKFEL